MVKGLLSTVNYNYDIANRLATVNGVAYTYDDNGNLLNDGVNTYVFYIIKGNHPGKKLLFKKSPPYSVFSVR